MKKVLDLMKRMGEPISTTSVWGKMITDAPIIINEGLITSYDSTMVLNAICDSFHLAKNGDRKEMLLYTIRGTEYVYIGDAFLGKEENGEDVIKITLLQNQYRSDINVIDGIFDQYEGKVYSIYKLIKLVKEYNFFTDRELRQGRVMLRAAAMTYVASVASTLIQILRLVLMFTRRND